MKKLLSRLNKGDKIGVWTASDPIGAEAAEWIDRGKKTLEKLGFYVVSGNTLKTQTYHTAGTAECRWNDFSTFIKDPEIKLIITALGGENAHQILPLMDFELISKHSKIIMGYSDPTVFLNPIATFSKIPAFYGYHLASFDPKWSWFGNYDKDCFKRIFIDAESPFEIPASSPRECWRKGICEGHLVGGSLTDLVKLLATPWEPSWNGAVLILETMNQKSQNIDVYITHLLQAGVFDRISGLVLGKFYNCCISSQHEKPLKETIMSILSDFNFPILKTVDFGHFSHMCPLPLGIKCQVNAHTQSFQILEPMLQK